MRDREVGSAHADCWGRHGFDEPGRAQHVDRPGRSARADPQLLSQVARGHALVLGEKEGGQYPRRCPLHPAAGQGQRHLLSRVPVVNFLLRPPWGRRLRS